MIRPIIPPQSQPLMDNGQIHRSYWLFLNNLQDTATNAGGIVQFGKSSQRTNLSTQGLVSGTLWLETDTGLIYQWQVTSTSAKWVCILGTQQVQMTLTTSSTTINAPTAGAPALVYFIDQDGTGGRAITWGTGFSYTSNSLGSALANTRSTFLYFLDATTGLYVLAAQPTVDMTK